MTELPQSVREASASGREDWIGLLRAMIAAQRVGEEAVQDIVAARLRAIGAEVDRVAYRPADVKLVAEFAANSAIVTGERASVVGRVAGGANGRSLILFAHPDSEPVRADHGWTHDPFAGTIADGRLYGWGVADDLLGVAAGVAALECLARAGVRPGGAVTMASTPSKRHARGVAALLHGGLSADAAVYLHPAESGDGFGEIKALASGQLEFRITVEGKAPPTTEPGHTAFAHLAVNPIDKALLLHAALKALDAERGARVHNATLDRAVGRSTNLMVTSLDCGEAGRASRIPKRCTLVGAVSFPPGERYEDVQAEIAGAIAAASAGDPHLAAHPPGIEWISGVTGVEIEETHPLFRAVAGAVRAVTGKEARVNALHTSSDIRNPAVQKGIPTVGLGPLCGSLTQAGGRDEWVDVADYLAMIDVVAGIILAWTGPAGEHSHNGRAGE